MSNATNELCPWCQGDTSPGSDKFNGRIPADAFDQSLEGHICRDCMTDAVHGQKRDWQSMGLSC